MPVQDQKHKIHHVVSWVALASVIGHVFCCGIPLALGILSLIAGLGTFSAVFPGLDAAHAALRDVEIPMLLFSLSMVMLGWGLQFHASKVDCHDTGCEHPPCNPRKTRTTRLLWLATFLFFANFAMLVFAHDHAEPLSGHDTRQVITGPSPAGE